MIYSTISLAPAVSHANDFPLMGLKECETGKIENVSYDYKNMAIKMNSGNYFTVQEPIYSNMVYDAFKSGKSVTIFTTTSGTTAGQCSKGILSAITIN